MRLMMVSATITSMVFPLADIEPTLSIRMIALPLGEGAVTTG
jgi:hypothetical protein